MTRAEIMSLLFSIVSESTERKRKVWEFQEYVFQTEEPPSGFDDQEWEVMSDLAYDLDFVQESLDGEDRVIREIQKSMSKLSST
jgi:hypothetical protein